VYGGCGRRFACFLFIYSLSFFFCAELRRRQTLVRLEKLEQQLWLEAEVSLQRIQDDLQAHLQTRSLCMYVSICTFVLFDLLLQPPQVSVFALVY
jgi:hypothetical protein